MASFTESIKINFPVIDATLHFNAKILSHLLFFISNHFRLQNTKINMICYRINCKLQLKAIAYKLQVSSYNL